MDIEIIRQMLNKTDVNISDVSRETKISKVSLYNIKKGKQIPSDKNFGKICKYFAGKHILDEYPRIESLAKMLQDELVKSGKETTLVITPKIIGKLDSFEVF